MTELRQLAIVDDYDPLIDVLRAVKGVRGLTDQAFDELTGLQSGYIGKLFGPSQVKRLGPLSMKLVLRTLCLKLIVVEDVDALAQMQHRYEKRERAAPAAHPVSMRMIERAKPAIYRNISALGVKARMKKIKPKRRAAIARHAARSRWRAFRKSRRQARSGSR